MYVRTIYPGPYKACNNHEANYSRVDDVHSSRLHVHVATEFQAGENIGEGGTTQSEICCRQVDLHVSFEE